RNSLDALCKRYGVDNSNRELHGALLDAEILADVYLAMTGGQSHLSLAGESSESGGGPAPSPIRRILDRTPGRVIRATEAELAAHAARLAALEKASGAPALWAQLEGAGAEARCVRTPLAPGPCLAGFIPRLRPAPVCMTLSAAQSTGWGHVQRAEFSDPHRSP